MRCSCGGETMVRASRRTDQDAIRRRRECVKCGLRFSTFESRLEPRLIKRASDALALALSGGREESRPAGTVRRASLRSQAKAESRVTGEPVEVIYQRWGCA